MNELAHANAEAQGFANIALIKYMGKRDPLRNVPCNPSLSYTLPHLKTTVAVTGAVNGPDRWEYLSGAGNVAIRLSPEGERRFLGYVRKLCDLWDHPQSVLVRSANNFPADAGIASSASSFSAATKAVAALLRRRETAVQLARLSRIGSGSSCRSFFAPWCMWDGDRIDALDFPVGDLLHMVVIVDDGRKSVSSSDAHLRVGTSPRFAGREDRARLRMNQLLQALKNSDWRSAYEITSAEFHDMHELFHTSDPPFRYRTPDSDRIVQECGDFWATHRDGPIVTMDAGPNVHLLFRQDQKAMMSQVRERYSRSHRVMSSKPEIA
jgi:diphosphomevalonate decarboxylase